MNREIRDTSLVAFFAMVLLSVSSVMAEESDIADVETGIASGGVSVTLTIDDESDIDIEIGAVDDQQATESEEACDTETCETADCESATSAEAAESSKKKSGGLFSIFFGSSGDRSNHKQDPEDDGREFTATHEQVALLKVEPETPDNVLEGAATESWSVKSFCLDKDDNILVAIAGTEGQLQLLDPNGDLLESWSLPIVPEALNVDADGNFLVAGQGTIYKLSPEGEVLFQAKSPLVVQMEQNKEQMRKQVIDQIKSQAVMMVNQRDTYQRMIDDSLVNAAINLGSEEQQEFKLLLKRVAEFEKNENEELTLEEENAWALRKILLRILRAKVEKVASESEKQIITAYTEQLSYIDDYIEQNPAGSEPTEETIESTLKSTIAYKSQFASIGAAGTDVFIATGAMQGYGFSVWRFDDQLENPEQVVKQLSGCCGQMDVQCCEEGIFVAENSRHRVCHFDREGKKISSWGKGAREGVRGFGGCCNPMNVAFGPDGTVYTAESESGRIKRFTPEGELLDLVGSVQLVPGCKKVSVAVTKDGKRVYMLDITRNHIIVMEAKQKDQQIASN